MKTGSVEGQSLPTVTEWKAETSFFLLPNPLPPKHVPRVPVTSSPFKQAFKKKVSLKTPMALGPKLGLSVCRAGWWLRHTGTGWDLPAVAEGTRETTAQNQRWLLSAPHQGPQRGQYQDKKITLLTVPSVTSWKRQAMSSHQVPRHLHASLETSPCDSSSATGLPVNHGAASCSRGRPRCL